MLAPRISPTSLPSLTLVWIFFSPQLYSFSVTVSYLLIPFNQLAIEQTFVILSILFGSLWSGLRRPRPSASASKVPSPAYRGCNRSCAASIWEMDPDRRSQTACIVGCSRASFDPVDNSTTIYGSIRSRQTGLVEPHQFASVCLAERLCNPRPTCCFAQRSSTFMCWVGFMVLARDRGHITHRPALCASTQPWSLPITRSSRDSPIAPHFRYLTGSRLGGDGWTSRATGFCFAISPAGGSFWAIYNPIRTTRPYGWNTPGRGTADSRIP